MSAPPFPPFDLAVANALSDQVCDAASPLLFAKADSDVGHLVECALVCASALLRVSEWAAAVTGGRGAAASETDGPKSEPGGSEAARSGGDSHVHG